MRDTNITFTCDRCGRESVRPADVKIAEEELPAGWERLGISGAIDRANHAEAWELCEQCAGEARDLMADGGADRARRFARWFLSKPHSMRIALLREQGMTIDVDALEEIEKLIDSVNVAIGALSAVSPSKYPGAATIQEELAAAETAARRFVTEREDKLHAKEPAHAGQS